MAGQPPEPTFRHLNKQQPETEKNKKNLTHKEIFATAQLREANHEHKKIITNPFVNGTFGFSRHTRQRFKKPKEPFLANAPKS